MTHTEEVAVSRAEELRLVFAERDRLRERNAELVKALEASDKALRDAWPRCTDETIRNRILAASEQARAALAKSTT